MAGETIRASPRAAGGAASNASGRRFGQEEKEEEEKGEEEEEATVDISHCGRIIRMLVPHSCTVAGMKAVLANHITTAFSNHTGVASPMDMRLVYAGVCLY